jgi:soluble cytochrome b562
MDTVLFVIQWLIAPVAAFVWMMHLKVSRHDTDIALLKSQILSDKLAHDREMKDVKEALRSIAAKLDNIEQALRER